MKLLTSPKTEYLLQAGKEVLHAESQEWLDEISFMQDEIKFFDHLLLKLADKVDTQRLNQYEELNRHGVHYWQQLLKELNFSIVDHEAYLADIIKKDLRGNEDEYRRKHSSLKFDIMETKENFTDYKRALYKCVKTVI